MSCFHSDIAIQYFDVKPLQYTSTTICWKIFRDNIFIVWPHSIDQLNMFFDHMNKVDPTKYIQLAMEVATDTLEFLDLKVKFDKQSKHISVDVFAKDTDSFTCSFLVPIKITLETSLKVLLYVLEGFAILVRNLKSIMQNIKNYLIARDYKPGKVKNNFQTLEN